MHSLICVYVGRVERLLVLISTVCVSTGDKLLVPIVCVNRILILHVCGNGTPSACTMCGIGRPMCLD